MEHLQSLFQTVQSIEFNNSKFITHIALICLCVLVLGLLGRFISGKRSSLNHSVSSSIGILFLYIFGIFLYGSNSSLSNLLASLPFIALKDDMIAVFSFSSASFHQICQVLLRMVMLAFFVNLLDTLLPRGKNLLAWLVFRLITVFAAVLCQVLIVWFTASFLPDSFMEHAASILLIILVATLLLGALKLLIGVALVSVNPIIGVLYTFFFSNLVGKQLSSAVLSTTLISILVLALNQMGYVVISLAGISLVTILPGILILLVVWYLVNQVL